MAAEGPRIAVSGPPQFHTARGRLQHRTLIITGTCRAGKTLLARVLGSMEPVEWVEEPWVPMMIPVMVGNGTLERGVGADLLRAVVEETCYDRVLYRTANFRPGDQSSIWNIRSADDIRKRLIGLTTRAEVREHTASRGTMLLLVLPETNPFLSFFFDALPACRILHVKRDGLDVALEAAGRAWFSDERLSAPPDNQLYYPERAPDGQTQFFPWWIAAEDRQPFRRLSLFARGAYYWRRLMSLNADANAEIVKARPEQYREIRYEDLLRNRSAVIADLAAWLDVTPGSHTSSALDFIRTDPLTTERRYPLSDISASERHLMQQALSREGYGASASRLQAVEKA